MVSFSAQDLGLLLSALAFSAQKHRDQRRKDAHAPPYINHPIAVANLLCNEAGIYDIEVICGAILHDTVEDTDTLPDELEQQFGAQIRRIVMDVTDDKGLSKQERKRKQVEHAAHLCEQAKLVKIADKICNLRDIAATPPVGWTLERRQGYFFWAREVVDQLRGLHAPLEQLFDQAFSRIPES